MVGRGRRPGGTLPLPFSQYTDKVCVCRYFPYFITVAGLTIIYIAILLWLISQRRLLPSIVIIGAFMFFVLWMVGLIVVSIELWGPTGSVSANCNNLVFGQDPGSSSQERLAWLAQRSICMSSFSLSTNFQPGSVGLDS